MAKDQEASFDSEAYKREQARNELVGVFRELKIGIPEDAPAEEELNPLSIVTKWRDAQPKSDRLSRETALMKLLAKGKVPFGQRVRVGILWGAAYGIETLGERVQSMFDNVGFNPEEQGLARDIMVSTAKLHIYRIMQGRPSNEAPQAQ